MKIRSKNFIFFLFSAYFALIVPNACAHKVNVFAYVEEGVVYSESYFIDGKKCKNSFIEVYDENDGKKLLEGKTDDNGKFSFKIPKITNLKIILKASMGHQAEYVILKEELVEGKSDSKIYEIGSKNKNIQNQESELSQQTSISQTQISEVEVEKILERSLEKKLKPIVSLLIKIQENAEKPKFTEIIGGIGYIIGIFGIILYFKKNNKKS